MKSMTGYGRALVALDGRELSVEMKSVNHRFLDLNFRMPRVFMFAEDDMRKLISTRLARGHVDIYVTYKNLRSDAREVRLDRALLDAYMKALDGVESLRDDRALMSVAAFPDVLSVSETAEDEAALRALISAAIAEAVNNLSDMRSREGAELAVSISGQINDIERIALAIEARYPETVAQHAERLRHAVEGLIGQNMDESRLLTEIAIIADRSAVDEEIVRLKSHISQLRECVTSDEPMGRRADFIVQELNREVNTISSKSQDLPIANLALEGKAAIEKLREQIQNIE